MNRIKKAHNSANEQNQEKKNSQQQKDQEQGREKSEKKAQSKQNDDDDDDNGTGKAHGIKSQKWDKRSIYDKSFDDVTTEAAKEFVDYLRRKEDRSKTSGEVANKFLRQLIEQGRYDDANRWFPDETEDFYRIAKFLNN